MDDPTVPLPVDALPGPAVRARILQRFERWLDGVLDREPPPDGIDRGLFDALVLDTDTQRDGGAAADLYSVVAGLTALTREVQLQGRAFRDLRESVAPLPGALGELQRTVARDPAELDRRLVEARQEAREELLGVLLDVRDRLHRGQEQARTLLENTPSRERRASLARLLRLRTAPSEDGHEAVAALEKGYALGLARLDDQLKAMDIAPMAIAPGTPFDPHSMKAVDVQETDACPEGAVCEVYRTGYLAGGRVMRVAEVKVARAPAARESTHEAQ